MLQYTRNIAESLEASKNATSFGVLNNLPFSVAMLVNFCVYLQPDLMKGEILKDTEPFV